MGSVGASDSNSPCKNRTGQQALADTMDYRSQTRANFWSRLTKPASAV